MDALCQPTRITFNFVEGESPLLVGLDLKRYSNTNNMESENKTIFKRPTDTARRVFNTYIADDQKGNPHLWLDLAPSRYSTMGSLMQGIVRNKDLNIVKKVHRFTHASAQEMKSIFTDSVMLTPNISKACDKVHDSCDICASSGRPKIKKRVSLSHINEQFTQEVQADFTVAYAGSEKLNILNIVDLGTNYGERIIAPDRKAATMMTLFEKNWIYHYGEPKSFSADPEFTQGFFQDFLKMHQIVCKPRPARSSSKNGKVERNNGVFKSVLGRVSI